MSKEEYLRLLKECGLCTKKWTIGRIKYFKKQIKEYMNEKSKKKNK